MEDSVSPESGLGKTPGLRESSTLCYCMFMASFITKAEVCLKCFADLFTARGIQVLLMRQTENFG